MPSGGTEISPEGLTRKSELKFLGSKHGDLQKVADPNAKIRENLPAAVPGGDPLGVMERRVDRLRGERERFAICALEAIGRRQESANIGAQFCTR